MAKVSTEKINIAYSDKDDGLKFSFDINVDKDGIFSTTLPTSVVELFESAQIKMGRNRMKNRGYFTDKTLDGLKKQIKDAAEEYMSKELVSEKIVLKYVIQTRCSYCLDPNGEPVPNGQSQWVKSDKYEWKNGTVESDATHQTPFGLLVYVEIFWRRDFKYKSGIVKTEYEHWTGFGSQNSKKSQPNLQWLEDLISIAPPDGEDPKEIDYTEEIAGFFVNMIKSICKINERIKDFLEPEAIAKIAASGQRMLV